MSDRHRHVVLQLLAPYVGIGVGLLWLHSAWAGILIYHAQILAWNGRRLRALFRGWHATAFLLVVLPALAAGPVVYFLLPFVQRVPDAIEVWLSGSGLSRLSFALMVPYFAVVNPLLEELHWSELRGSDGMGWAAHLAFTLYHGIVLLPMIHPLWMAATLVMLLVASLVWHTAAEKSQGLLVPALSHMVADTGVVLAAYAMVVAV